jgi:hypothetical protein
MKFSRVKNRLAAALFCAVAFTAATAFAQADPLPSWNDGKAKQSIVGFVAKVTKKGSPDFVPVAERIATFDNDGTLWAEQPLYFQFLFAIDRVKALATAAPGVEGEGALRLAAQGRPQGCAGRRREGVDGNRGRDALRPHHR